MEVKYVIDIHEYQPKKGSFDLKHTRSIVVDVNTSTKELFKQITETDDRKNKFYMMQVIETNGMNETYNFYTIRTDVNGSVEDIQIINPNNFDKDILIDAIIGCKITDSFAASQNDAVIRKCIKYHDNEFVWAPDTHIRLQKVNVLRLKEIYNKLKKRQL